MPDIGQHPLGRIPSEPDERNWRLAAFLDKTPTKLDALLDAMMHSSTSRTTKAWATEATRILNGTPAPPSPQPTPNAAKRWVDPHQLDQGETQHCVGFGWAQFLNCDPVEDNETDADGHAIYYECKVIDGQPKQENGSSVHSGAKAIKNRGRIAAYAWASTLKEITDWVLLKGPVIVGTDWTDGMFNPDAAGMIHPTGAVAGGHCYLIVGYDDATKVLTFQNSWGTSWGQQGFFTMRADEWWQVYQSNGEACAAVELA